MKPTLTAVDALAAPIKPRIAFDDLVIVAGFGQLLGSSNLNETLVRSMSASKTIKPPRCIRRNSSYFLFGLIGIIEIKILYLDWFTILVSPSD
jgi:hypothetical protein